MNEKIIGKTSIKQKSMDIVSSNFDWNFAVFNPMVFDREPYAIDISAKEFLEDYLTGIKYLYDLYEQTKNSYYIMLAERLLPVGMKNPSN